MTGRSEHLVHVHVLGLEFEQLGQRFRHRLEAATEMVPDDLARSLIAFGSEDDVRQRLQEYVDAGASYPILITEQEDVEEIIRMFAPGTW